MTNKHKGSKFEDYMAEPCGLTHKELSDALNEAELRGEKRGIEKAAKIAEDKGFLQPGKVIADYIRKAASEIGKGKENDE